MIHFYLLLDHWISLWTTTLSYWRTGYLYGTLSFLTGLLAFHMVHCPSPISPLPIPMILFYLLLDHWISLWYTSLSYRTTGYHYGTLLSSTAPLDILMVHYPFQLTHWISLWYTSPPIDPLVNFIEHYYLLLTHWISLWYTTLSYWSNGYLYGTHLSSTGPLDISVVHYHLLLAH